tara:strand:+ start:204 stop:488 length:285 start_codon:yes stop_codon:yes gene_type:complete
MRKKINEFYNSDLYIKITYGIPALILGGFTFILFSIFTIQILHETVYGDKDLDYDIMIKEYRYNHRLYHKKDMERMDKIIELMDEINKKTEDIH